MGQLLVTKDDVIDIPVTFHDVIDKVMTLDDVHGTNGTVENRRTAVPFFDGTDRNRRNRSVPATTDHPGFVGSRTVSTFADALDALFWPFAQAVADATSSPGRTSMMPNRDTASKILSSLTMHSQGNNTGSCTICTILFEARARLWAESERAQHRNRRSRDGPLAAAAAAADEDVWEQFRHWFADRRNWSNPFTPEQIFKVLMTAIGRSEPSRNKAHEDRAKRLCLVSPSSTDSAGTMTPDTFTSEVHLSASSDHQDFLLDSPFPFTPCQNPTRTQSVFADADTDAQIVAPILTPEDTALICAVLSEPNGLDHPISSLPPCPEIASPTANQFELTPSAGSPHGSC
jgi:hypothetical protein